MLTLPDDAGVTKPGSISTLPEYPMNLKFRQFTNPDL